MKFAENTSVAVTKTKQELEVMVTRAGATHFDEAFLAHIVVPTDDGRTTRFGNVAIQAIADAYTNGGPPRLLLTSGGA